MTKVIPLPPSRLSSIFRNDLFKNKVAIVTGGGTGIGRTIASELLYLGCSVVIASRDQSKLLQATSQLNSMLKSAGKSSLLAHQTCNIRNEEDITNLMKFTMSKFGRIDFLVNNGGGQFISLPESISKKGWNAVVETNLTGTFLCCREVFNAYMREHGGAIVNITMNAFKGIPLMAHSSAARAGVENMTMSLAVAWAEYGVRVNSVAPGGAFFSETAAANYADPSLFENLPQKIPLKRLGRLEELSSSVCYLLSPGARFVTGTTTVVDGGARLYENWIEVPDHDRSPYYSWDEDTNAAGGDSKL